MPSTYALAEARDKELLTEVVRGHHTDIDTTAVKIDLLFAFRDPEGDAPAILKDGLRVLGKVSPIGLKDRIKGMGDAEIIIDGDAWGTMNSLEKLALLDHFLTSLEVKRDKAGEFVYDDYQRPVLKSRPHDRVIRLYHDVAVRHGANSIEVKQMEDLFLQSGKMYLPEPKGSEKEIASKKENPESTVEIIHDGKSFGKMSLDRFTQLSGAMRKGGKKE